MLSGRTRLLGVIGHPIVHSLSPRMHNAALAQYGAEGDGADYIDYVYVAMDVQPERLRAAVRGLAALGFVGFNVTMPHKEVILSLLDELDPSARLAGAVNTVVAEGGKLRGLNTDGSGFIEACEEAGVSLAGRRVLILGAGGAAAAIAVAALGAGASWLCIANRTLPKAEELRRRLSEVAPSAKTSACPLEGAASAAAEADILVNATYLGMKREDPLPLPAEALGAQKVVCDAVYLPGGEETALIRSAREAGARTVPGDRMLLYQGVQAQRVWTGREPNVKAMSDALAG
jgi:shikimate dehydrogenase